MLFAEGLHDSDRPASAPSPRFAALRTLESSHEGGYRSYAFPLVMIGHGILWGDTIVLIDKAGERAVIVQANLNRLCSVTDAPPRRIRTPLCEGNTKALADIALAVARAPRAASIPQWSNALSP